MDTLSITNDFFEVDDSFAKAFISSINEEELNPKRETMGP